MIMLTVVLAAIGALLVIEQQKSAMEHLQKSRARARKRSRAREIRQR